MRLKIVISISVLTGVLVVLFWWASPRSYELEPSASSDLPAVHNNIEESIVENPVKTATASSMLSASPDAVSGEVRSEQIADRVAELMDLAMTDDPASLDTILSELSNPEPRIREAAVEAAVQFKSSVAVPALRDAAGHADDPGEKIRLLKAIEFLSIPNQGSAAVR
jgi:HEAT repeat protein